jgi:hypothetical protein
MVEKEKIGWPNNIAEKLLARSFFGALEKFEHDEKDFAKDIAQWALANFLSGDVQRIKQSVYLTDANPEIRLSDLIDDQVTIVRACGKDDIFDWFIIVHLGHENYLYSIGTPGSMGTLEPRVQNYSINELKVLSHQEVISFLVNQDFLELMNLTSEVEKFDIVFSGFMEDEKVIVSKKSSTLVTA